MTDVSDAVKSAGDELRPFVLIRAEDALTQVHLDALEAVGVVFEDPKSTLGKTHSHGYLALPKASEQALSVEGVDLYVFEPQDEPYFEGTVLHVFPEMLPASPLSLDKKHPIGKTFELAVEFAAPLTENARQALSALLTHEARAYRNGIASFEWDIDEEVLVLSGKSTYELEPIFRGHCYWILELLDRFFDVKSSNFIGDIKAPLGARPSWVQPSLIALAAVLTARLLSGPGALLAGFLVWAVLPLMFTAVSRRFVGRWTWAALALCTATQAVLIYLFLVRDDTQSIAEVQSYLELLTNISRGVALPWAITYVLSQNRPV